MAGFAAHEIFGEEVLRGFTNEKILSIVEDHRGIFGVGCQGPDLFLYNIPMLACGEERNLGVRMHREGTGRFFAYLWQTVWEAEDSLELEVGLSYFYGALAHYTLDTMVHPYIYARIGYDPEVPYSKKATRGLHHRLEAAMDAKLLAVKRNQLPSRYKPCESLEVDRQEKNCLAEILVRAVRRTYKIKLKKENVFGAIKMMRLIACGFYGGSGRKRRKLEEIERYFSEDYLFSNLMVTDEDIRKRKVMNHENMLWQNPWDSTRESRASVWEIYEQARHRYREYREEFEKLESKLLQRREELILAEERKEKRDGKKKGEKKILSSDIIDRSEQEIQEEEVSGEISRAVMKLGNLSYHSGLPI